MNQIEFDDGERPKYKNEELTDNDLLILYACCCTYNYFGHELDDYEKRGIFRKLLFKDTAEIPDVANTFKNPDDPVTQKVAEVAEQSDDFLVELHRRVTEMYHKFLIPKLSPEVEAAFVAAIGQTPFTIPKRPFDPTKRYTKERPIPINPPERRKIQEMIDFYWGFTGRNVEATYAVAQYQAWLAGKDPIPEPQQETSSSASRTHVGITGG